MQSPFATAFAKRAPSASPLSPSTAASGGSLDDLLSRWAASEAEANGGEPSIANRIADHYLELGRSKDALRFIEKAMLGYIDRGLAAQAFALGEKGEKWCRADVDPEFLLTFFVASVRKGIGYEAELRANALFAVDAGAARAAQVDRVLAELNDAQIGTAKLDTLVAREHAQFESRTAAATRLMERATIYANLSRMKEAEYVRAAAEQLDAAVVAAAGPLVAPAAAYESMGSDLGFDTGRHDTDEDVPSTPSEAAMDFFKADAEPPAHDFAPAAPAEAGEASGLADEHAFAPASGFGAAPVEEDTSFSFAPSSYAPPEPAEEERPTDGYDLGADVEDLGAAEASTDDATLMTPQGSRLDQLLDAFSARVDASDMGGDSDARYEMGQTFRGMEMWDRAITEYQHATRDADAERKLAIAEALGECLVRTGDAQGAYDLLMSAIPPLDDLDVEGDRYKAMAFYAAEAAETLGNLEDARELLEYVVGAGGGFRDAEDRLARLGR